MTGREVAWRVIAREITSASEEERGSGERVASYLITPLGARANRVLIVGQLSPPEMIGKDESAPFYRSRLVDPTGEVPVTAGGFHPRALASLRQLDAPQPVLLVGKAHLYRGRDGNAYPSVRAEAVHPLPAADPWPYLAESLDQVSQRFDLSVRLRERPEPDDTALDAAGFPREWVAAARIARARYPSFDLETFRPALAMYADSVEFHRAIVAEETSPERGGSVSITRDAPPPARTPPSAAERARESAFLDVLDELADASLDGYADLRDAVERARARGIDEREAEAIVGRLEEAGIVEEPIVGKLRRA